MAYKMSLMVVAVLALAICQPVASTHSDSSLRDMEYNTCRKLLEAVYPYTDIQNDGQKLFDFAKDWLKQNTKPLSMERKVIKAWQAVAKEEECSESSWENVVLLNFCGGKNLDTLRDQIKSYTARCITPQNVSKKIKEKAGGMFSASVNFINDAFIKKFHEDNPNDLPLKLSTNDDYVGGIWLEHSSCCDPKNSKGAVLQAIEHDLKGKDPKKEFHDDRDKLESYMNKKLTKPCKDYVKGMYSLRTEILAIANQYEGAEEALFPTLDTEAQNIIFRFKFCEMLERHNYPRYYASQEYVE